MTLRRKKQEDLVQRHLVMFASLFLFLWGAISIGCSSKTSNPERPRQTMAP